MATDSGSGTLGANDLLVLRGDEIVDLFRGREAAVMEAVKAAYLLKEDGDSRSPNCPFLRFPDDDAARIIPKPAYLGGDFRIAGIKWVASFPGNLSLGLERASAAIILNGPETGRAVAFMEGAVVSACRTAASAALAAGLLFEGPPTDIGLLGCGVINFETLRFLLAANPGIGRVMVHDIDPARAERFRRKSAELAGGAEVTVVDSADAVFRGADVVSVATNATIPHRGRLDVGDRAVVLHISLRDFTPEAILEGDNVVDDVEHVCTNRTSLDLTASREGGTRFIRSTIGAILRGDHPPRAGGKPVVFSPFGLGILDLAVARLAYDLALARGLGTALDHFPPTPWIDRRYGPPTGPDAARDAHQAP